jgi:malate dehydrogenase (quinone)
MMRFGPTAKMIAMMERRDYGTVMDYLKKIIDFNLPALYAIIRVMLDPKIFFYGFKNIFYDWPIIGKRLFISHPRNIIPSIKLSDIRFAKGIGGSRPQIVNIKEKKFEMGEAKICGDNIIFNITPSPGATRALGNAYEDTQKIISFLGPDFHFDKNRFDQEYVD